MPRNPNGLPGGPKPESRPGGSGHLTTGRGVRHSNFLFLLASLLALGSLDIHMGFQGNLGQEGRVGEPGQLKIARGVRPLAPLPLHIVSFPPELPSGFGFPGNPHKLNRNLTIFAMR